MGVTALEERMFCLVIGALVRVEFGRRSLSWLASIGLQFTLLSQLVSQSSVFQCGAAQVVGELHVNSGGHLALSLKLLYQIEIDLLSRRQLLSLLLEFCLQYRNTAHQGGEVHWVIFHRVVTKRWLVLRLVVAGGRHQRRSTLVSGFWEVVPRRHFYGTILDDECLSEILNKDPTKDWTVKETAWDNESAELLCPLPRRCVCEAELRTAR